MAGIAKAAARYEAKATGADRCRRCKWFDRPASCEIVIGPVNADGWCKFFHAKAGERRPPEGIGRIVDERRGQVRRLRSGADAA